MSLESLTVLSERKVTDREYKDEERKRRYKSRGGDLLQMQPTVKYESLSPYIHPRLTSNHFLGFEKSLKNIQYYRVACRVHY